MWNIINTIIGAVGCITGPISIILIIRQNKFSQGKLIASLAEPSGGNFSFYFDPQVELPNCSYPSPFAVVLSLKIINQSAYPLCIDDLILTYNNSSLHHVTDFNVQSLEYRYNDKSSIFVGFAASVSLPVRLEPFESRIIGCRFPFAEADSLPTTPIPVTLEIKTSRKPLTLNLAIKGFRPHMAKITANRNQVQQEGE